MTQTSRDIGNIQESAAKGPISILQEVKWSRLLGTCLRSLYGLLERVKPVSRYIDEVCRDAKWVLSMAFCLEAFNKNFSGASNFYLQLLF